MPLTLGSLKNIAKHAMSGGTPAPTVPATPTADATLEFIVNQAGRLLLADHPWQCTMRPPANLGTTASQTYTALPADFAEMEWVEAGSINRSIALTTPQHLMELRRGTTVLGSSYFGAVFQAAQADVDEAVPAARLELWPTPDETMADAFKISYRAGWTELDTDTDVPNLPAFMDGALVEVVRAYAKGGEEMDPAARQVMLAAVLAGPVVAAAKKQDGSQQGWYGPIRNGAAWPGATMSTPWNAGAASNPS